MERKRGLIGLATLVMATLVVTLGLAPRPAFAAETVVSTGEGLITAIEGAPTNGTEQVIRLEADISTSKRVKVDVGKNIVLDLAGQTWKVEGNYIQLDGGSLTVRSSESGGEIAGSTDSSVISTSRRGSSLRLEGGTISHTNESKPAVKLATGGSVTFEMTGGAISAPLPLSLQYTPIVTIAGGTITATGGEPAITIVGGSPSLTVGTAGNYEAPTVSGTISISDSNPVPSPTLNLVGGTIGGISGSIPSNAVLTSHFSNKISEESLPEGKECVQQGDVWIVKNTLTEDSAAAEVIKSDGTVVLFETVASAASSLADGDTLVLRQDVSGSVAAKVSGSATIDLNGHSVISQGDYAISVEQGDHGSGTVTIKNTGGQASLTGARSGLYVTSSEFGDVTLDYRPANISLEPSAAGVELGNARMADTAQNEALVTNGGFRATVDGKPFIYGTAYAATKNADDGTSIVLLNDYSGDEPMRVDTQGTFVIDLNGHTYETSAACAARVAFSNVDVTFTNGSIVSTSTSEEAAVVGIYLVNSEGNAVEVSNVALTLDNVDLSMENSGNAGVIVQGLNTKNAATLDGCTLTVPDDVMGIYFPPADSTLIINDTTITAGTGIGLKGGTLSIGGATQIHARGANDPEGIPSSGGIVETGAAIYIDGGYVDREVAVNVTGGTFVSEQGSAIQELVNPDRPADTSVSVAVTGGSFSDASMRPYLAGDAAVVACEDGTYDVYPTESEALANGGSYKVVDGRNHLWLFSGSAAAEDFAEEAGSKVERIQHTVTFDDCWENTDNAAVTVAHNEPVARPTEDPTADGWKFLGWYEAADGQYAAEPYDFETPVTADLTLYAKWERVSDGSGQQPEPEPEPERRPEQTESAAEKTDGLAKTSDVTFVAPLVASAVTGMVALGVAGALRRRNG